MDIVGVVAVAAVMAVGMLGVVLPFLPGTGLIWGAGLVYGVVSGFGFVGWSAFVVMTVLLAAGAIAKYALPHRVGVASGVPRSTLLTATALGIVGFFVVPVIGLPLGAAGGVLVAEHSRLGNWPAAWRTTRRVVTGYGVGVLIELVAAVGMIAAWLTWVLAAP